MQRPPNPITIFVAAERGHGLLEVGRTGADALLRLRIACDVPDETPDAVVFPVTVADEASADVLVGLLSRSSLTADEWLDSARTCLGLPSAL